MIRVLTNILVVLFLVLSSCKIQIIHPTNNEYDESLKLIGAVQINDSLYIDQTEVTLKDWLSFYTWTLENKGLIEAEKLLPDSSSIKPEIWQYINTKASKYNSNISNQTGKPIGFFLDKCDDCINCDKELKPNAPKCAFLAFPITGISYEQAILFCNWSTIVQGNNEMIFRLPTVKEWKEIVLSGLTANERMKGYKDSICKDSCQLYNYKAFHNNDIKLHVRGLYKSDSHDAYDLFGNVSEITNEKGISKGGNYLLFAKQCHPDSVQKYNKPERWLGLRCVRIEKKH